MMPSNKISGPLCTRSSLAVDFMALGLKEGDTVLLHSSLKSLGWVCGAAETVVFSLLDALGDKGTLVVPTHSGDNSDPSEWSDPPVPENWFDQIRENMPAYNPRTTRSRSMGAIPEMLRTWPGAVRSMHPQTSFTAVGALAKTITSVHPWDCRLGERSPLGRLEEVGAKVLLLGVGFEKCTAFHLAEYRGQVTLCRNSFAVSTDSGRQWLTVDDVCLNDEHFGEIGRDFERDCEVVRGKVGVADARLFSIKDAVAFSQDWLQQKALTKS